MQPATPIRMPTSRPIQNMSPRSEQDQPGRVQEIAATVRALAPIVLAYVPNGSAWVPVVDAATSLLPTVLAYVGIAGASATAPVYVPNAARLILLGAR